MAAEVAIVCYNTTTTFKCSKVKAIQDMEVSAEMESANHLIG